jgi:hypothetical protein
MSQYQWDDFVVNPFATSLGPNVRPPDIVKMRDDGINSVGVYTYSFDDSKEQEVFFDVQLPHGWVEGSEIRPHVHFTTLTQTATSITWGLEYTWSNIDEIFPNSTIITQATACPVAYTHTIGNLGTISGTGKKISSILNCRLFRVPGGYAGGVLLLSVDIHIMLNSIGSS